MPSGYFDAERQALYDLFVAGFTGATIRASLNDPLTDPSSGSWVTFTWKPGVGRAAAVGGAFHRFAGVIIVQVFVTLGDGLAAASELADLVAAAFLDSAGRGVQLSTTNGYITCDTPYIQDVGPDPEGYYQVNVSVPYRRDNALT